MSQATLLTNIMTSSNTVAILARAVCVVPHPLLLVFSHWNTSTIHFLFLRTLPKQRLAMPDNPLGLRCKQPATGATSLVAPPAHAASSAPRPPAWLQRQKVKQKEFIKAHDTHVAHHSNVASSTGPRLHCPYHHQVRMETRNSQRSFILVGQTLQT